MSEATIFGTDDDSEAITTWLSDRIDDDECNHTGDPRAVAARCLFADHPICRICADRVADRSPDDPDVPAIEDHEHNTTGVKWR